MPDFKQDDLINLFDNFIKPGVVIKEKEVIPGLTVKLKVLNTGELLTAESIIGLNKDIPLDVAQKVRAAGILTYAIISINGVNIEREDASVEENRQRRVLLYNQLLQMPPFIIQKMYMLYLEAVKEQEQMYNNVEELKQNIENF